MAAKIKKLAKDIETKKDSNPDAESHLQFFSKSIAPSIFGHENIKKGVLL